MAENNQTVKNNNETGLAALATIPVVGLVIYFGMKDASDFVKHYAKQSIGLLLVSIVLGVVSVVAIFIPFVGWVVSCLATILFLGVFVLWLMLVMNALQGKKYSLPMIDDLLKNILK